MRKLNGLMTRARCTVSCTPNALRRCMPHPDRHQPAGRGSQARGESLISAKWPHTISTRPAVGCGIHKSRTPGWQGLERCDTRRTRALHRSTEQHGFAAWFPYAWTIQRHPLYITAATPRLGRNCFAREARVTRTGAAAGCLN